MKKILLISILVIVAIGIILAGRVWWRNAMALKCVDELRMISAAKGNCSVKFGLKNGDLVPESEVAKYCKDGVIPKCPSGGKYSLNVLGKNPKCSLGNPNVKGNACWHRIPVGD
jgi:hypothetical protein